MSDPGPDELADLYDHAPFGYLSVSTDGKIITANATFGRWMDCRPQDLIGRRLRDLLTIPGRILYETNVAPLLRLAGGFEEVALDLVTTSGGALPVLANANDRRGDDGKTQLLRVAFIRAKDRRSYERDLKTQAAQAAERLRQEEENAELREQFIAVLGHDLRNPLASIVGAARLLRREGQSEKALRVIGMMESSVDRMAGLIDDVMDFARGRLGSGISLHRQPAMLEPVLRQAVEELEASLPSRSIHCEVAVPELISCDSGRIGQLVSNLLGNALTHGDPKAPVHLGARMIPDAVEIWVANAGAPIPAAAMDRLFQPFFRGEVRASQQGLGLGLHIASEIARAHGGTLTVASDQHETRFTLTMPLQ